MSGNPLENSLPGDIDVLPVVPANADFETGNFRDRVDGVISPANDINFLKDEVIGGGDISKVYELVKFLDDSLPLEPELVKKVYGELFRESPVTLRLVLSFLKPSEANLPLVREALNHRDGAIRLAAKRVLDEMEELAWSGGRKK